MTQMKNNWIWFVALVFASCKDDSADIDLLRNELTKVKISVAIGLHNDSVVAKALKESNLIIAEQKKIIEYQSVKMNENYIRDKNEKIKIKNIPIDKLQSFTDSINKVDRARGN
jgi:hypothetical protein